MPDEDGCTRREWTVYRGGGSDVGAWMTVEMDTQVIVEDAVEVGKGLAIAGLLPLVGVAILSCETVVELSSADLVGKTIAV